MQAVTNYERWILAGAATPTISIRGARLATN
jgi:hypothetical protein